ncbi:hypothetical protein EF847_00100 [Actinobacteria bacterium YIM 96077]|uniref:Uncharacterized protein n=1 Tax=Phytoactinopolyspora halophila TaxID=1981511 RepID=A0A329QQS3_9ACTN|nr:hypothetical protein [Phytoactinopolyspora halophila]AYY11357.1 hypothetical protein EF847_00100 [Actinobacteria bacterium YIM 96077]RAW14694.1 hypothetical protein DPM12_10570 [Phytoactinopolyspora halophila]
MPSLVGGASSPGDKEPGRGWRAYEQAVDRHLDGLHTGVLRAPGRLGVNMSAKRELPLHTPTYVDRRGIERTNDGRHRVIERHTDDGGYIVVEIETAFAPPDPPQ